jgi:RNA polymerase sigma-54 factor
MKPSMRLSIGQQLTLTPQLQQAIRLLQLSTLDLKQEIQNQIESNPMLEATSNDEQEDEQLLPSTDDSHDNLNDVQWSDLYSNQNSSHTFNEDINNYDNIHCTSFNLQDYLRWQLDLTPMTAIDHSIATTIIDTINEDGFLTTSLTELHHALNSKEYPITYAELEAVRHRIQHFDPIGCGASNLAEALLFQLEQRPVTTPHLSLIKKIINENITLLGKHDYRQLMKIYHIDEVTLDNVVHIIHQLNPKPGSKIPPTKTEFVIPDLTVKKIGHCWRVELNQNTLPSLSINSYYASLLQRNENSIDHQFLKNNLQEARWFLKSIQSRQETLLKVARYIVDYQKGFLEFGEAAMKPLILNDVATALGLHESTISRITTQKFIDTPRGLQELKYFFSSHVPTSIGGECSSTAIRALLKKLITAENAKAPLSDNKLAELISDQGIQVARRTVAKYREMMGIAPSSARKAINIKTTKENAGK